MKILIIGGNGTIGKKVSQHFSKKHEVIVAARQSGEVILADHPVEFTTSAAMVNGGLHSFVKAASLEMKKGIRINVVSSGLVEDAVEKYEAYFPGHNPIPMKKVINGYVKSVEGRGTGEIIRMCDNC
jgi:NAD(P)-dependent dehydrogenase (short-subunit alcohol dehydrogenase family)